MPSAYSLRCIHILPNSDPRWVYVLRAPRLEHSDALALVRVRVCVSQLTQILAPMLAGSSRLFLLACVRPVRNVRRGRIAVPEPLPWRRLGLASYQYLELCRLGTARDERVDQLAVKK
eukprot:5198708-Pleurochrysis_carterae.AAC.2